MQETGTLLPTVPVPSLSFGFFPSKCRFSHSSQAGPRRGRSRFEFPPKPYEGFIVHVWCERRPGTTITRYRSAAEIGHRHPLSFLLVSRQLS